ncbi:toxin VasX [Vibrio sp. TRT 17S01]|uniref:toxin VasX n=1 Tax=Vibrio sp. TRT 17S01 TaxID=3418505 RepID=UPI003CEE223C
MSNPNDDAKTGQTKDAQDPAGTCPLKKSKIQLIPTRYALVESKPLHSAISSKLASKISFRPIGIRTIDSGYLYVIHSKRQDIIYVYKILENGEVIKLEQQKLESDKSGQEYVYLESEKGLFVNRKGKLEVLYSPTKISPKLQSQLLNSSSLRSQMMQSCSLGTFDCTKGSQHLLPTNALKDNLADCEPNQSEYESDYQWCWLKEKPTQYDSQKLLSQINYEYKEDSAILLLEDPIGVMTELSSCGISLNNIEAEWFKQDNNQAKYFAASQIKLLIEVGERYFNANTNNQKLKSYITSNESKLKKRFLSYQQAKRAYWDFATDQPYYVSAEKQINSEQFIKYQQERLENHKLSQDIGISQEELESFFHDVKRQNDKVVEGEFGGLLGDRGILARIEHDDMEEWYKDAQLKIERWRNHSDVIENDRVAVLPFAYDVIPVYDKENKDAFVERLIHENHWLEIQPEEPENRRKIRDVYFGGLGEQNLHVFVSDYKDLGTIDKKYRDINEWIQYLAPIKGVKDNAESTINGLSGLEDFKAFLKGQNLVETNEMPEPVKAQFDQLGSKLSGLALEELNELSQAITKSQDRANSLIHHARPGIIATLLGHKKNANIQLDVGDTSGFESFNKQFSKLEEIRLQAEDTITKRNLVESTSKGLTTAEKDALRADYNRQLKILGEDSQQALMMLAANSEPVAKAGQPHLPSHITIKASGATADEINQLLATRQKILTNELLYGVSEGKGFKGALGSGSVALVVFALNAWNWSNTQQVFSKKSALNFFDKVEYISGFTSFLSSAMSLAAEVTKLKFQLSWISNTAEKSGTALSKVITISPIAVSFLVSTSSIADMSKQGKRLYQSWRKGDLASAIAASAVFIGDGIQASGSSYVTFQGGRIALSVVQNKITWAMAAEKTFGVVARVNPYLFFASALILLGEVGYNFLQSTPLMNWVSQSSWGKDGIWFWHKKQHWDDGIQFTKWLEATQIPVFQVSTNTYKETLMSASGNWATQVTKHRVYTLRIIVPMATPQQIKLAGYVKTSSNTSSIDITETLIGNSQITYDGMNTLYEFDWPQDFKRQENLRYLELMVEVTSQYGNKLFAEQGGARFTLDLDNPASSDNQDWYQVDLLEEDDEQSVSRNKMISSLKKLMDKVGSKNEQ